MAWSVDVTVTEAPRGGSGSRPVEEFARLKAHVDRYCPVLDLLSNATPVDLELRVADRAA